MVEIEYNDTVTLIRTGTSSDGYGTEVVVESASVNALILLTTTSQHSNNQDAIGSVSVVYLDPNNDFVIANSYRLEEMIMSINLFGVSEKEEWYKIDSISINRDNLLSNQIDNILVEVKKTSEISNVS